MQQQQRRPRRGTVVKGVVAAIVSLGAVVALGGVAAGSDDYSRPHRSESVTFTAIASDIKTLGPELCLDPAVTTENCLRSTRVGHYDITGDLTGTGVGVANGVTANATRRSQSLLRWTISSSPCGSGTITVEAFSLLPIVAPGDHAPEAISSSWRLIPEQGTGDLAGVRGSGTITGAAFLPNGSLTTDFAGKVHCR